MQESETIECKKSLAELSEGLHSMSAILNKHGKGELWFGIRNDGHVEGIDGVFTDSAQIDSLLELLENINNTAA